MTLVGSDLTERTTTSTGNDAATLSSVSGLNISQGTWVKIVFRWRKTAGAASAPKLGIKINDIQIISTSQFASSLRTGSTNEAQDGTAQFMLLPGETNYTHGLTGIGSYGGASEGQGAVFSVGSAWTNAMPVGAITSIAITGDAVNGAITLATDELRVYTLPTE
ncbi:MAG: hypothetical protein HYV65_02290 [Candidatus Spechtbacteria bacterium]|nr:hypothetical protein [Candidatus Spechtbacteria bacterium]